MIRFATLAVAFVLPASYAMKAEGVSKQEPNAARACEEALALRWARGSSIEPDLKEPYAIRLMVTLPHDAPEEDRDHVLQGLGSFYPGFEPHPDDIANRGNGWNVYGHVPLPAWRALRETRFAGLCSQTLRARALGAAVSAVLMMDDGEEAHRNPVVHGYWRNPNAAR